MISRSVPVRSLLVAIVLWSVSGAAALEIRGIARVVDGDTLSVEGLGVRLHGIDAPESSQSCVDGTGRNYACGEAASRRLRQLADGKQVVCDGKEFDQYKRFIGTCRVGDQVLNRTMIDEGLAWAFVRYSQDYIAAEAEARSKKIGVFASANTPPWDFRSGAWQAASAPKSDCPIKGNVSRGGEKIYHMPWQRDYARIQMEGNPDKRWFCNENEAVTAGWRKAAR